ncbi:unnamed protein product, partial [Amoebophrya sp. A120]
LKKDAYVAAHVAVRKQLYAGGCPMDMSGCPIGFTLSDGTCYPTASYTGYCGPRSFSGMTNAQKTDFAWKCGATFPCAGLIRSCPKDYRSCPIGFSVAQNGTCMASTYRGSCSKGPYSFQAMNLEAKMRAEEQCGFSWPCASGVRSYSATCPVGFAPAGIHKCKPSPSYAGPCTDVQNFTGFNAKMLALWEHRCGAYWIALTKDSFIAVHIALRKQLFAGGCPMNFSGCPVGFDSAGAVCVPGSSYSGFCGERNFSTMDLANKVDWAWRCGAAWPCSSKSTEFAAPCPQEWSQTVAGCSAPPTYAGICSPTTDFTDMTDEDKARWAADCDATW